MNSQHFLPPLNRLSESPINKDSFKSIFLKKLCSNSNPGFGFLQKQSCFRIWTLIYTLYEDDADKNVTTSIFKPFERQNLITILFISSNSSKLSFPIAMLG